MYKVLVGAHEVGVVSASSVPRLSEPTCNIEDVQLAPKSKLQITTCVSLPKLPSCWEVTHTLNTYRSISRATCDTLYDALLLH